MTEQKKKEIEVLALAAHRASERRQALSVQNISTDPVDREKQAVAYALATAEMFEARRALDVALATSDQTLAQIPIGYRYEQ